MFTATADLILPSTVTGSFRRPRWFDVSMWGRPLDTCMLDVRFALLMDGEQRRIDRRAGPGVVLDRELLRIRGELRAIRLADELIAIRSVRRHDLRFAFLF